MPCKPFDLGNGVTGVVCSRGQRAKRCAIEGCGKPAPYLCDFPLTGAKAGKTCDRPMCESHRRTQGRKGKDTVDYCPSHDSIARGPQLCGEEHPIFCSDEAGEHPLKCGLPKGHAGEHQDARDLAKVSP